MAADPRRLQLLVKENYPIRAENNRTGKSRDVLIRTLHRHDPRFYLNEHTHWRYMLATDAGEEVVNRIAEADGDTDTAPGNRPRAAGSSPVDAVASSEGPAAEPVSNFDARLERARGLPQAERAGVLDEGSRRLEELARRSKADVQAKLEALFETSSDTMMVNKAAVDDALGMDDIEAKTYMQRVVSSTHRFVRSLLRSMVDEVIADEAFESLVTRSNGTVVQHMSRVFMNGTAFLLHYNRSVLTTGLVSAIRARFVGRYKKRYRQLLPHVHDDHLSLERVFMGGMRALSPDELHNITLGFLLHDVGKVDDIEYHEGEAGYDRDTVERHVKRGYQAVMNKTTYPREAGLITGYHHEYYGDPSGYGYFRELLGRYRRENPDAAAEYCIAYALEPIVDYQALAFFGAKVLEIVDVYDALTDKNRRYRSPLSSDDALHLMRTQFLDEHLKLDPILFEIYDQYVRA